MNCKDTISRITERWFVNEPALFAVTCQHGLRENRLISVPMRCGKRTIEYNPDLLEGLSTEQTESLLRTEAVRILLKHPYERRPADCCAQASAVGSNITVGDNYPSADTDRPQDFELEKGRNYEWYARRIQERLPRQDCDGNAPSPFADRERQDLDRSGLWGEDPMMCEKVNDLITGMKNWGSLPGGLVQSIIASTKPKMNWRNVLSGFRSSILCSERRLTRMRPSRRSGFDQAGSTRQFTSRVLVAVDTSGSVSEESLQNFFGTINSAFRYGISELSVLEFDAGVASVTPVRKARGRVSVHGRGGTDFQAPVDYAFSHGYDGLLILTDGYAPAPTIPAGHTKILWVCENRNAYETHRHWMRESGRVTFIDTL